MEGETLHAETPSVDRSPQQVRWFSPTSGMDPHMTLLLSNLSTRLAETFRLCRLLRLQAVRLWKACCGINDLCPLTSVCDILRNVAWEYLALYLL